VTDAGRPSAGAKQDEVRAAIVNRAVAAEKAGALEQALQLWTLLENAGGTDAEKTVARSRVAKLTRRINDQRHARRIVAAGDEHTRQAVLDAEQAGRVGLVVEVRRLQAAAHRDPRTLAALGSALRRAGDYPEAASVLEESIRLDPSRDTNRSTHVAQGALLRETGQLAQARALLEDLRGNDGRDPYTAAALAAVYMDYAESRGHHDLLEAAEKLIGIAYAQQRDSAETRKLYGRLDKLRRQAPPR
jgi:tetratricopeptide (TPR) repeat protein